MDLAFIANLFHFPLKKNESIIHFAYDSRDVRPGSLFFAIKGNKVDGHDFIEKAVENGATAVVVSKEYQGPSYGVLLLPVPNVIDALQRLAKIKLENSPGKIIAITGSIGKTTTKEFIATLLEKKFRIFRTPRSSNSQIALPASILNSEGPYDLYVLEMAMSEEGQLRKLVKIAPPDIAVLTRISYSHAAFFSSIEEIARAKAELFSSSKTFLRVIHKQTKQFKAVQDFSFLPTIVYGEDVFLQREQKQIQIVEKEETSPWFTPPFNESHLLENFLCGVTIARFLGLSFEEIIEQSKSLSTISNRFEKIQKKGILYINDSYNANEDSTIAALENLPLAPPGKKRVFVFGDMKELGSYTKQCHENVANRAVKLIDICLCLGSDAKSIYERFLEEGKVAEYFTDRAFLHKRMNEIIEEGDIVLIKGANSHRLWELLSSSFS